MSLQKFMSRWWVQVANKNGHPQMTVLQDAARPVYSVGAPAMIQPTTALMSESEMAGFAGMGKGP